MSILLLELLNLKPLLLHRNYKFQVIRMYWMTVLLFGAQFWSQGLAWSLYPSFNRTGITTHETLIVSRQYFPALNRFLITVNNSFPAPPIYVPLGNDVRIVIINEVFDDATAIHWHGMTLVNASWTDGSPNITQCAITNVEGNNTLVDIFIPETAGSFFYHGHYHSQLVDGINCYINIYIQNLLNIVFTNI